MERLIVIDHMRLKAIHQIPLTVLAITVLSLTAFGQVNDNLESPSVRIAGRVTDVTKAGVPNTVVTLKAPGADGTVAKVRSDQDGHFSFPLVSVQEYEIRFESPGFESLKLQANSAVEGGNFDLGTVVLRIVGDWGDRVDILKQPSTPASPIHTTLCELVKEGDHFHGEFVELRAAVSPSGSGVTRRLTDSSCGANVGLHFPEEPTAATVKDLPLLRRYVEQHRVVMATVSGKFTLVLVYHGTPRYTLYLEGVSDLVVTQTGVSSSPKTR